MPNFDIAVLADLGQRDAQEDSVAARYVETAGAGYAIVADGMGGHDAGDIASGLVMSSWRGMLDNLLETSPQDETALIDALPMAAMRANASISDHVESHEDDIQMGSTMLGALMLDSRLFWISIGDSPLYLVRDDQLHQLNDDHSMAPIIDAQAESGEISRHDARTHPDRNLLRSVIMGAAIPKVDCPETPFELLQDDVLVVASDGLQYLDDDQIEAIVLRHKSEPAQSVANELMSAVRALNHPDQDNVSVVVVKPSIPCTA
ncbi:PP2C family protein-serine/threonine phosphatase [Aliiroseovarius halocynthiae]|nr:protein phosphatase 2C domain-containing protein [Aliiroseovarius halocynthiae]